MPLITPMQDLLADAPPMQAPVEPATPEAPGVLDTLAASFRQHNVVSSLYERISEGSMRLPGPGPQKAIEFTPSDEYDPFADVGEYADDMDVLRVLMRAESPEEMQFLKNRIRREKSDRDTIAQAGGWGLASSIAAGLTDPVILASMAVPVAPALAGVGRAGKIGAGIAAQAALDTTAEAVLHSGQELRTIGESAFNVGAGALLSGVLGTIATRVPKAEFEAVRANLKADITGRARPSQASSTLYHGTDARFDALDVTKSKEGGIFLTGNREHAQGFGQRLLSVKPKFQNLWTVKGEEVYDLIRNPDGGINDFARLTERARQEGYDGILIKDFKDVGHTGDMYIAVKNDAVEIVPDSVRNPGEGMDSASAARPVSTRRTIRVFHGTDKEFDTFDPDAPRTLGFTDRKGMYFTTFREDAAGYGKNVKEVDVTLENPKILTAADGAPAYLTQKNIDDLRAQGYDGIIYKDGEEVVAFDAHQITDPTKAVNPGEGMDSASAARVAETSLEDEGIARGGQTLAKYLGHVSPLTRTLRSPIKSARVLAQRLVDVPYLLTKHTKGIAGPQSVESQVKRLINTGRFEGMKVLDEAHIEYRRAGGTLTRKQFSEEVSTALTRGDLSDIPQVAKAVSWARKVFEEDKAFLKEHGIEFGEEVMGAKSYFPRVYNFERIIKNRADFENRLFQWYKNNPKTEMVKGLDGVETPEPKVLENAEIKAEVIKTVERILGTPSSRAELNLRSKTSSLKSRVLDVPDDVLAPYLERDFETVMAGYFRGMAPEIEMRRAGFSSPEMKTEIDEISDEAARLKEATTDNAKKEELRKLEGRAIDDLKLMRDRLMGNVGVMGRKNVGWVRALRIARTYNYVRLLGSQMLSSMSDYGRLVSRYGLPKTVAGTAKFLADWNLNKMTRADAHRFGTALEWVLDSRTQQMADIMDELPRTRFDKSMQWASNQFSRVSLMSPWNATMKSLATLLEQDEMARAVKRMNKRDVNQLARAGFSDTDIPKLREMFAQHGETIDGITRARTEAWGQKRLARMVEDSIAKVADEVVVTKGYGDLPAFMDGEVAKTLLQFRSFAMASVNRTMIPMAQGAVNGELARTAQGFASMFSIAIGVYYAKELAAGRKPNTDPDRLIAEGLSWSGMLGYLPDLWDPIASSSGENEKGESHLPRFSRFKSRDPTESWMGPTFGTLGSSVLTATNGLLTGDIDQKDIERVRRLMPFQNLFYVRQLFNAIEGEVGEAIGAEGSTTQDFTDRLTELKPSK